MSKRAVLSDEILLPRMRISRRKIVGWSDDDPLQADFVGIMVSWQRIVVVGSGGESVTFAPGKRIPGLPQ